MSNIENEKAASHSGDCPQCPNQPVLERIETRSALVGESLVIRRALPNRQRKMVGAWCFFDHAGPADFKPGQGLRVGPHPHIGLQTFTWMIEGEVLHRDSLGNEQVIRPGQVNLMTAGRGIAHSEDSATMGVGHPEAGRIHAAQLWIALPDKERHREPAFQNYPDLPTVDVGGFHVTVLAGTGFGLTSPVKVYSPLVGLDLTAADAASVSVPLDTSFEHAALTLRGEVSIEGEILAPGTLLYLGSGRKQLDIRCTAAAQVLIIGGTPFDEEILLWWNFVARTQDEIKAATLDWNTDLRFGERFGEVKDSPSPRLIAPELARLK